MNKVMVERAGVWTTIQDAGRIGWRHVGMPSAGAMDMFAYRAANAMVGNVRGEAVLELTIDGPTLVFEDEAVVCLCGGDFIASLDDGVLPLWRPVYVPAGGRLRIGAARSGYRGYLAVAGGFDVPAVLGSRSMYPHAHGFAGLAGRALAAGDALPLHPLAPEARRLALAASTANYTLAASMRPEYGARVKRVRCFAGAEHTRFAAAVHEQFAAAPYVLSAQSDRMGLRLAGASLAQPSTEAGSMPSAPAAGGNIQVPPNGQPIVLAADGQTIGGYPRIAQVAAVDMPILAQARPGDAIQFEWITVEQAEQLWHERERDFQLLNLSMKTLR
jgi:antagonist of KipI